VLLIDDVRTTGATLRAASKALRAGGVAEVYTFVLATRVLVQAA
jgi:predicted amidophosphoribosyltransferase